MKDAVIIKSLPHGITLLLNPDMPFPELCTEVCRKFAASRDFFGDSTIIISFEGRELSVEEEAALVESVELNTDVKIRFVYENDELRDRRMIGEVEKFYSEHILKSAAISRSSVRSGEQEDSSTSIIIMGDVKKGAIVNAKGNVIVMGSIEGAVHAGTPDNENAFISALFIDSDDISIGNVSGDLHMDVPKKKLLRNIMSNDPVAVFLFDGVLRTELLKNGALRDYVSL